MKQLAPTLARAMGLAAWSRARHRRELTILMYHGIVEQPLEPFCWHQLARDAFERQIDWVARHMHVLPLDDALARLDHGTLPEHACAITFDDGYRSNVTLAEPILARHGMTATVFLPTDAIGDGELLWPDRVYAALAGARGPDGSADDIDALLDTLKALPRAAKDARLAELAATHGPLDSAVAAPFALLDWDEVRAARARGVLAFGPHSRTHEILARCDDAEVRDQVLGSCEAFARRMGEPATVFAYPNGRAIDFDDRARAALDEAGVRWALATTEGRNGPGADARALRRIGIGADLAFARFVEAASGWRARTA